MEIKNICNVKKSAQVYRKFMMSKFIGTWKLIEHSQINEDLNGLLIYHPNQTMSVLITGKFDGKNILIAYSGRYFIDHNFIVHEVEVSDKQARLGTEQRRYFVFGEDKLILTESAQTTDFKAIWKKVK